MTTPDPAPFFHDVADAPEGGETHWFRAADGVRLRISHWPRGERGTVLLFPGRTECVEKYGPAAGEFAARGYATVTLDWRGQGLSDRLMADPLPGHVACFADYQKDVTTLLAAARRLNLPRPFYLVAHSMGGAIGLRALHEGLPVRAAAFSAPMWGITMAPALRPVAWSLSWASRAVGQDQRLTPGSSRQSYFTATGFAENMLTSDPDMWAWMQAQVTAHPDLALGGPTLRWLAQALREVRTLSRLPAPDLPTYTARGSAEQIVDPAAMDALMRRWSKGRLDLIEGARHEVMMEIPETRTRFYDGACALFAANP